MGIQLPAPLKRGHNSPHFSAMYCGQTPGWIKMPHCVKFKPKRHLDRFSRFCTAHSSVPTLYNGPPFPMGDLDLDPYLWLPYVIGGPLYFCPVVSFYLLSIFFFLFFSPNLSGHRLDVYHTSTHGVALVRI